MDRHLQNLGDIPGKKLNLGCGTDIRRGWTNLDRISLPGVDMVHDVEHLPLPFSDEEFDYILCKDILEHVDYIPLLQEIYRILRPQGTVCIRVPHFSSRRNYDDPTHKKMFSLRTLEYFTSSRHGHRNYYFPTLFSDITTQKLFFEKGILFYNHILEPLFNSPSLRFFYERSCLRNLFPADFMVIELKK
jgi:ubiquinone/menaquinone biosynthesis C-methylase UbiE